MRDDAHATTMTEAGNFEKPRGQFRVVGIAGSLRRQSLNRALLCAAVGAMPEVLAIVPRSLADIPLYSADVEAEAVPAAVADLRAAVRDADAILIATPEYNHGVPGVLKNAIDWLSRPSDSSVLRGKPCAIIGASPGMTGTARAQSQLRQAFAFTNTYTMPQPELLIARAHTKFDPAGRLTDEATRTHLTNFLNEFARWIERVR